MLERSQILTLNDDVVHGKANAGKRLRCFMFKVSVERRPIFSQFHVFLEICEIHDQHTGLFDVFGIIPMQKVLEVRFEGFDSLNDFERFLETYKDIFILTMHFANTSYFYINSVEII